MRRVVGVLARLSVLGLAFFPVEIDMVSRLPGRPGWLEFRIRDADGLRLLVKVARRGQRLAPTRLIIDGQIDAQTLRAIPFGRVEAVVNRIDPDSNGVTADTLSDEARAELVERGVIWPEEFQQIDEALDRYLEGSRADLYKSLETLPSGKRRMPLTRPDGSDPEGFARRVAEAYNAATITTASPAKVLAEEAGVPVTTVHRWIREARQRGALPPARKGRAG